MSTIISVSNVSKQYRLGEIGSGSFQQDINRWWHKIRGKEDPYLKVGESNIRSEKSKSAYTWALRNINFSVNTGEIVGIVGPNGAGKSTLLKILSRVTDPTIGKILMNGRVASLLEVGTGMHPDLTGRENIFLNGTILGMTKKEISKKFDEIVDFSGVERYIDTPVKRYSSGMHVRLGFAVAAHLEPEILIVDEVLAVGDAEFQKKCLGKMNEISRKEGRTILFVSHNLSAIESLCSRALLIQHGELQEDGNVNFVLKKYLDGYMTQRALPFEERKDRNGNGLLRLKNILLENTAKQTITTFKSGEDSVLKLELESENSNLEINDLVVSLALIDEKLQIVLLVRTSFSKQCLQINSRKSIVRCLLPNLALTEGRYSLTFYLGSETLGMLDLIHHAKEIDIKGGDFFGTGEIGDPSLCKNLHNAQWIVDEN